MYLEDLDAVTRLEKTRTKLQTLRRGAESGYFGEFKIDGVEVWSTISADPVREAIKEHCDELIADINRQLSALGVNTACKLVKQDDAALSKGNCP